MNKKILSLILGTAITSTALINGINVLAAPTKTPSRIINSDGTQKEKIQIPVQGSIEAWNNNVANEVDVKDAPQVAQLSVTVPTKMVFTVATNVKTEDGQGKFISPEYKITNNGNSADNVKVTLESVEKNDNGILELNDVNESTKNNGKVEIDLKLQLADSTAVDVRKKNKGDTVKELGTIVKGESKTLKLLGAKWELPTSELRNGTEKVESKYNLTLGFELSK
ncbi:hypothetical protein [Clostridium tarantellae]|uniref:WxL domain-containing protein n=1 Tax=Clostridium tarantellae TaxID=39493 RepID=A0A6I1MMY9_9CLOT|nr:hypothetical protein [Clostridium tarantellae]MPQ44133.1 hypothetical protein [Clostridium tarantellae]